MILSINRPVNGLGLVGVLGYGLTQVASIGDAVELRAGIFACGSNHLLRANFTEQHRSLHVIKKPNPQIKSLDMLTEELSSQDRPMQTHIEWSNLESRRGVAPSVGLIRIVRNVSDAAARIRASAECRRIGLKRWQH